jgi:uncharacterized protein involved in exopolysaccharide biosynthesis
MRDPLEKRVAECLKLTRVLQDEILRHLLEDVLLRLSAPEARATRVRETYREERAAAQALEAELRADGGPDSPSRANGWNRYQVALNAHQEALRDFLDSPEPQPVPEGKS